MANKKVRENSNKTTQKNKDKEKEKINTDTHNKNMNSRIDVDIEMNDADADDDDDVEKNKKHKRKTQHCVCANSKGTTHTKFEIKNETRSDTRRPVNTDNENISKAYSKYVFKTKPIKNVKFNEDVVVKNYTVSSDDTDSIEPTPKALDIEHAGKDKLLFEIINCKSRDDVERTKAKLVSQIDILIHNKSETIDCIEELKNLKNKIQLLYNVNAKLIQEEEHVKSLESENKLKNESNDNNMDKSTIKSADLAKEQVNINQIQVAGSEMNPTDWLFNHIYGSKNIHLVIYFDLTYWYWTRDNFQQKLLDFFKHQLFKEQNVRVSLIYQYTDFKFKSCDLEKSTLSIIPGKNIYECLTANNFNWPQDYLHTLVHVNDSYRNFFQGSNNDQLTFFQQQGLIIFGVKVNIFNHSSISRKDYFNFVIKSLNDFLNLNMLVEIFNWRRKYFRSYELFILRRISKNESAISSYQSKSITFNNLRGNFLYVQGELITSDNTRGDNEIILTYFGDCKNVNGKILYDFRNYLTSSSRTIHWLEPVDTIDVLFNMIAEYSCAKDYVKKFNAKNREYNKLKISEMFGIRDQHGNFYFVNRTNEPLEKSNLVLQHDPDLDLKNSIMQAFTHFTYEESKNELIIIDLRSIVCNGFFWSLDYILITEPVVFSSKNPNKYSAANLSTKGINMFIKEHKCNQHCRNFGLTPFH